MFETFGIVSTFGIFGIFFFFDNSYSAGVCVVDNCDDDCDYECECSFCDDNDADWDDGKWK